MAFLQGIPPGRFVMVFLRGNSAREIPLFRPPPAWLGAEAVSAGQGPRGAAEGKGQACSSLPAGAELISAGQGPR